MGGKYCPVSLSKGCNDHYDQGQEEKQINNGVEDRPCHFIFTHNSTSPSGYSCILILFERKLDNVTINIETNNNTTDSAAAKFQSKINIVC